MSKRKIRIIKNGGDGMFFYHKKTGHPAKQLTHTKKTWTNKRYTHSPNRMKDYQLATDDFAPEDGIYKTKLSFTDSIYTRGDPYNINKYKKKRCKQR